MLFVTKMCITCIDLWLSKKEFLSYYKIAERILSSSQTLSGTVTEVHKSHHKFIVSKQICTNGVGSGGPTRCLYSWKLVLFEFCSRGCYSSEVWGEYVSLLCVMSDQYYCRYQRLPLIKPNLLRQVSKW